MAELAIVSVTTVIFGIASLFLISRARKKLSEGSIRNYMDNFAICLAFIVIFSVWQTARSILGLGVDFEGISDYPEYIFIVLAYIAFIVASYRVMKISDEFGFKGDGRKIGELITKKPAAQDAISSTKSKIKKQKNDNKTYKKI